MSIPKAYTSPDITVTYDAKRCIHVAECVRRLPQVFDTEKRPWIQPNNATADEIAATVERCPSGALQYTRHDGGAAEPIPEEATIQVRPNGPLFVRGNIKVTDANGVVLSDSLRTALCRCGQSENKPFCDSTHRKIGFKG
jgi:uncharacterized Fe-S cluster protein YjdI